ncbi:hypothetical protein NHX12_014974, partial [Muraenolepis orangiensis]
GPVNAITVLTLLDKLVNMLDTVQDNQTRMEVRTISTRLINHQYKANKPSLRG